MATGVGLILQERNRQIEEEGWTPEHDDEHTGGELPLVAALFASPVELFRPKNLPNREEIVYRDPWPKTWARRWDKRSTVVDIPSRIKLLVKAGALIAAEIDRLQRKLRAEMGDSQPS